MHRFSAHRFRGLAAVSVAFLAILTPAAPAFAHGGGDSDESRVLVVQALSYLANRPDGYMDMVTDKVNDALEAPDKMGVDLAKVAEAQKAMDAGDMMRTRALLVASLEPFTGPVVGMDTGTRAMPDPMSGHTEWSASGAVFAALSGLAVLIGLVLAVRWRPAESIKQLRAGLDADRTPS